ncbi:MAG: TIGR02757 family protein [Deltaproteobacteria bacterium]|nr:TIGR02757 family protein [Deltaproteobacteria bacterium]
MGRSRLREASDLGAALDRVRAETDVASRLAADPVGIVHRYGDPADVEIAGLVAASLAFGNVRALRASVERALERLGPRPGRTVRDASFGELDALLEGFVHRTTRGRDLARTLSGAGALVRRHGSVGAALKARFEGELRPALGALVRDVRAACGAPARLRSGTSLPAELLPDPVAGSACKRLLLYLRWMIRPADGVDFGLWDLPARILVIPLDTHVHRIARNLGLTRRRDVSWRTAEEVTASLRRFDPEDPVGYDFALCHMGISRACPSRRDPARCADCGLEPHCVR